MLHYSGGLKFPSNPMMQILTRFSLALRRHCPWTNEVGVDKYKLEILSRTYVPTQGYKSGRVYSLDSQESWDIAVPELLKGERELVGKELEIYRFWFYCSNFWDIWLLLIDDHVAQLQLFLKETWKNVQSDKSELREGLKFIGTYGGQEDYFGLKKSLPPVIFFANKSSRHYVAYLRR